MALSEIQIKSIEMLLQGTQQKDVAANLGITPKTLQRWAKIPEYAARLNNDPIPQTTHETTNPNDATQTQQKPISRNAARDKEILLLDSIQTSLETLLQNDSSNLRIIDRLLKLSERRSKLLGLEIRNISTLDAAEVLLHDGVLAPKHAYIISDGIEGIEDRLKMADSI